MSTATHASLDLRALIARLVAKSATSQDLRHPLVPSIFQELDACSHHAKQQRLFRTLRDDVLEEHLVFYLTLSPSDRRRLAEAYHLWLTFYRRNPYVCTPATWLATMLHELIRGAQRRAVIERRGERAGRSR